MSATSPGAPPDAAPDAAPADELPGGPAPGSEPLDLRLVPAALATWACAGWAVGAGPAAVAAVAVLGAVGALALLRSRRSGAAAVALAAAGAVAVAVLAGTAVREAGLLGPLADEGATATVTGTVRAEPRPVRPHPEQPWTSSGPRWVVLVRAEAVSGRGSASPARAPVLVVGGRGWDAVHRGDRVRAAGRLVAAAPGDDVRALLLARRPPDHLAGPGPAQRGLRRLREGLVRASRPLPPDARGLVPGLVVGDTSALPGDLGQAMRSTGLTHLTAVSGGNTALVTGSVLAAAAAAGVPRVARLLLAGAALGAFAALAGAEPSVLRAAVMGVTGLVGLLSARRGAGLPALSAAVVVLLVLDPWLGRSPGFALSVLATGALLVLARPWARSLSRVVPRPLAGVLAVPLAAQAVCGPVVLLLAPGVPLTAVPANLLAAPAVAPATVLGLLATALEPWWPQAAGAAARLAGLAASWIAAVARTGAAVPAGTLPWPQGPAGAAALAAATAAAVLLPRGLRRVLRARDP